MDESVLDRELTRAEATARRRRRRRRLEPRPAWTCDNCAAANLGRRRRCVDCGTSRD